jgi:hypothetical protein
MQSEVSRREFLYRSACLAPAGVLGLSATEQHGAGGASADAAPPHSPVSLAPLDMDLSALRERMLLACSWMTGIAQIQNEHLTIEKNARNPRIERWKGAWRGEYSVADREWDFFGPVWHAGQAIKALVLAYRLTGEAALLDHARLGAHFLESQRISDNSNKDYGLIIGCEDVGDQVNTSAVLECAIGLLLLADASGEWQCEHWALDAASWVARNAYLGEGLFRDAYSIESWSWVPAPWAKKTLPTPGRPLLDDAIFLEAYRRTGNKEYRRIFYETADRLLRDEGPPGNWIRYWPCNIREGSLHPRQAYWWGYSQLAAYRDSGSATYLDCARRAGEWYLSAMRHDGGLMRGTYRDFNTDTFGHETSGIACAVILWLELWKITAEDRWLDASRKALHYCMRLQFTHPADPNLKGAVLEKVLSPDGTDRSPYHLRDLATIFFVQAASSVLLEARKETP